MPYTLNHIEGREKFLNNMLSKVKKAKKKLRKAACSSDPITDHKTVYIRRREGKETRIFSCV